MARIDFFGLGEMGYAMAGHLARAGNALVVHDLDAQRLARWQGEFGAVPEASQAEAVITSVTDMAALQALVSAPGGIPSYLRPGVLWIDHTTTSPAYASQCASLAARHGAAFVDAAMSGGKAGAQAGALTLFVGGEKADATRAQALTRPYCKHFTPLGAAGAGQAAKLAHQLAIAGTVLGLQAALDYGRAQGLSAEVLLAALAQGTAHSAQLDQHAGRMGAADFDFAAGFAWLAKDLAALPVESPPLPSLLQRLVKDTVPPS